MGNGTKTVPPITTQAALTFRTIVEFLLALLALVFWALDQFTKFHWARGVLLFCALTLLVLSFLRRKRAGS